jgi:hypothetical protein
MYYKESDFYRCRWIEDNKEYNEYNEEARAGAAATSYSSTVATAWPVTVSSLSAAVYLHNRLPLSSSLISSFSLQNISPLSLLILKFHNIFIRK